MTEAEEKAPRGASETEPQTSSSGEPAYDKGPSLVWFFIPIALLGLLFWFSRGP